MKSYKVMWNYRSSYGTLVQGEVVELAAVQAELFNRDSPGVVVEMILTESPVLPLDKGGKKDRQVKKAQTRQP